MNAPRIRPLPWDLGENGGIYDSEGRLVLSDSDDDIEATIVHRVNSHDALVKALRLALATMERDRAVLVDINGGNQRPAELAGLALAPDPNGDAFLIARAALAAAEAQ